MILNEEYLNKNGIKWSKNNEGRLTVGGWLDLRGTAITELPDDLTVGGEIIGFEPELHGPKL